MARASSPKVGRGPCPDPACGQPVAFRKSAGGLLTHRCEACDSSGYAEPGGAAFKRRMASMTERYDGQTPDPDPEDEGQGGEPAAGAPPRVSSVFQLGQL